MAEAEMEKAKAVEQAAPAKPAAEKVQSAAEKKEVKVEKPVEKAVKPEAKPAAKPAAKLEAKAEKKEEKPAEKKAVKEKKPKKEKIKPIKVKGSAEVLKKKKLKALSTRLPSFKGRFGQRMMRNVSKAKWSKWRRPRGIDIYFNQEDGAVPKTGFKRRKEIRGVHPSGFQEVLVSNLKDLEKVNKEIQAARIASAVGKKKKEAIIVKANELKVKVLNG